MSKSPKHILVIRLSAMGDVAMTVPVLRALVEQYPEVKLTVLTRSFFKPFFRDVPHVDVFDVNLKHTYKGFLGLYKLSKALKLLHIDAVADLHNVLRTKILKFFFFGIKTIQIDKGRAEKKALISGENFTQLKTTHQRYVDVFEKLGYPINLSNPKFPQKATLSPKLSLILGNNPKETIGIAPFATYESKMYPLDWMEQVIEALSKTHKIILFGGGELEIQKLNMFEAKFENVVNVAGKLNLNEELDVISNLGIMVSMDSGNAHIAAMLGIKVVTLWGVTHPYAGFYPFHQDSANALLSDRTMYPKIPTSVYGNKFPESYKDVMTSIQPETVIKKIKSLL